MEPLQALPYDLRPMSRIRPLFRTAVGLKFIVAVTGIVLFLWIVIHMLGNLKTFLGEAEIDAYAAGLKTLGKPILPHGFAVWTTRIILIVCLVLHMIAVVKLTLMNRAARPISYARYVPREATLAARTMLWSGPLLLVYVVYHLLHLTTGTIRPAAFVHGKVYANLYHSFSLGGVVFVYVAAVALLALHLYHGVWSFFQTVGLDNPDRNRQLRRFAAAAAIVLFLGFAAVPLSFLFGTMPAPAAALAGS